MNELTVQHFLDRVIPDEGAAAKNPSGVKKLIFCSGKVYYDLTAARKEAGLEDTIAISRVEQVRRECVCVCEKKSTKHRNGSVFGVNWSILRFWWLMVVTMHWCK